MKKSQKDGGAGAGKRLPKTRKPDRSLVDAAVKMALTGAPPRIIAAALGYSLNQYKRWIAIGQEEDAYELEHGVARDVPDERWLAVELYRGIAKAEAQRAVAVLERMKKAITRGDMQSARWWLERRVTEFAPPRNDTPIVANAPQVVFYVPDDGRDPDIVKKATV